jgi:pimeloyl-ACP methyl ester carboxylesterase
MASTLIASEAAVAAHGERPVRFRFQDYEISGILHTPSELPASGTRSAILFLNSGLRYRIGPYRQYVRFARQFCAAGYSVLRFDFPGGGDSSGEFADPDTYRKVFLDNKEFTRTALDYLLAESGGERAICFGLCSGAYNSLLSGAADSRIEAAILLALPTVQLGEQAITHDTVAHLRLHCYWRKLFQWRSWVNLLLLRSRFRTMGHAVLSRFRKGREGLQLDPGVWDSFRTFAKRGDLFLVYGDQDPFYQFYLQTLAKRLPGLDAKSRARIRIEIVERAGHTFSQIRFQQQIFDRALEWLGSISQRR